MSIVSTTRSDSDEQALRRMQAMLANISDTVTLVDADGHVLDTTGLHAQVMGYEPDYWRERSIFDLVDPDDLPRLLATRELVLQRPREQVTIDVRVVQSDSSWADIELTAVNLLEDPLVAGIVITSRNITARKAIEAELALRRDEAVEQSRLRSELLAVSATNCATSSTRCAASPNCSARPTCPGRPAASSTRPIDRRRRSSTWSTSCSSTPGPTPLGTRCDPNPHWRVSCSPTRPHSAASSPSTAWSSRGTATRTCPTRS